MSVIDPRTIMVVIGFMGVVSQALAAWWWFKASCHDMSEDVQDFHYRVARDCAAKRARGHRTEHRRHQRSDTLAHRGLRLSRMRMLIR
jgi:hypothetical protein